MITFMQKNKKYFVVTIWVSVICFIGAGFVGYGSVDLNINRTTSVAKVGDLNISKKEFQMRYSDYFNYYNQINNGSLDEEMALSLGLDKEALNDLIREKLLLNYANDLGFYVSDEEVAKEISQYAKFHYNGSFDKNTYLLVLKQEGSTPTEYEESVKNYILTKKVKNLLNVSVSDREIEMMVSSLFMQDLLGIKVLEVKDINVSDEELEKFWNETKQNYKTDKTYEISFYVEPIADEVYSNEDIIEYYNENKFNFKDNNDEILSLEAAKKNVISELNLKTTKTNANRSFVALKNGEKEFLDTKEVSYEDTDIINNIEKLGIGDMSRPFEYKDTYMIAKVNKINEPREKTFDEAKLEVISLLKEQKTKIELENLAKSYEGGYKNIGFISRDATKSTLSGLSETEFVVFLNGVFSNNKKQNYIILDNKAVVYKILDQKLQNPEKISLYKDILSNNLKLLKDNVLLSEVLEDLKKRYIITNYYKGN